MTVANINWLRIIFLWLDIEKFSIVRFSATTNCVDRMELFLLNEREMWMRGEALNTFASFLRLYYHDLHKSLTLLLLPFHCKTTLPLRFFFLLSSSLSMLFFFQFCHNIAVCMLDVEGSILTQKMFFVTTCLLSAVRCH